MSGYGYGQFHLFYTTVDGTEVRKAYATINEMEKARAFLEALGISPEVEMNTKKREWSHDS